MKKTYNIAILDEAVEAACLLAYAEDENEHSAQCLHEELQYCVLDHLWNTKRPLYKWRLHKIEQVVKDWFLERNTPIDVNEFMENIAFRYKHICRENDLDYAGDLIDLISWGYRTSIRYPVFHFKKLDGDIKKAA